MPNKISNSGVEQPQAVRDDPFAAFDSALSSLKEQNIKLRTRKERLVKVKESVEKEIVGFEALIETGTYDSLEHFPFAPFVSSLGLETGLSKQMGIIVGAKERIAKFKQLPAKEKDKPELTAAVEAIKTAATEAMRDVLKAISKEFSDREEGLRLQTESMDAEIREVLDSPIFDSEVRIEKESYEDYRERAVTELVEQLSGQGEIVMRHYWESVVRGKPSSLLVKYIIRMISEGKLTNQEALQKFKAMRADIQKRIKDKKGTINEAEVGDITLRHFGVTDTLLSYEAGDIAMGKGEAAVYFERAETALEASDTVCAAMRFFAEERIRMAIEVIEKECQTEEEKRDALEFMKTKLPKWSQEIKSTQSSSAKEQLYLTVSLPEHSYKTEGEAPHWFWEACRRFNEARIFNQMMLMSESRGVTGFGQLMGLLTTDQMLRRFCGEDAFAGEKLNRDKRPHFGVNPTYCLFEYSGPVFIGGWPKMTIDDDVIPRAMRMVEFLHSVDFYTEREVGCYAQLGLMMNSNFDKPLFRYYDGALGKIEIGGLELKSTERRKQQEWWEDVVSASKEAMPVGEEKINRVIEEKGYYPIRTLPEAVRIIDALKSKLLSVLQKEQTASKEVAFNRQEAERADRTSEALAKNMDEIRKQVKDLQESLHVSQEATTKVKDDLHLTLARWEEEKKAFQGVRSDLRDLQEQITKRVGDIQQISGLFGAEAKKREALEDLLEKVKKTLAAI